jgi:membrane-bound ClpP family serine protease
LISFYLIICLVGVILLVILAILGGFGADAEADIDLDIDADIDVDIGDVDVDAGVDAGLSPLSLPIFLVFITSFGAIGMVLEVFDLNWIYIPFISAGVGILIAGVMFFVMLKIFSSTQSTSVVPLHKLVGMKAKVSVSIKKGNEGQIIVVRPERGRMLIGAISNDNIQRDSVVEILEVVGDIVKVQRITKDRRKQAVMK